MNLKKVQMKIPMNRYMRVMNSINNKRPIAFRLAAERWEGPKSIRMNKIKSTISFSTGAAFMMAAVIVTLASCKKYLPEDRDTVGVDSQFTQTVYEPVLGRNTLFSGNFFQGSTSFPSTFKIVNPRKRNGEPAPELTDVFPVKVWKTAYTGDEKSIAEIEAKREIQNRPLFEVFPHSGQFNMWAEAKANFMKTQPDSCYLFDVELSNSGGRRYYRDMILKPLKERPYEPSNYDAVSGQTLTNGIRPSRGNIKGITSNRYLGGFDIDVYIRKRLDDASPSNTLRFMFLDSLYKPMDPALFSSTDWANLVHGFNMKMTATDVTYDVAYPIPLAAIPTRYTVQGFPGFASVNFTYPRLGFGGFRDDGLIGLDFAIYEPGDWEIVFAFKTDNPKFTND